MAPEEQAIEEIAKRLGALSSPAQAAFFAACAERLLPLYDGFSERACWGDRQALHRVADQIWEMLATGVIVEQAELARIVEQQTPHADDFDSLEATLAQDACICLDGALKALEGRGDPELVEYAIEALRAAVTSEKTGYLDMGDHPNAPAIAAEVWKDARVQREVAAQRADVDQLASAHGSVSDLVVSLRQRARRTAWSLSALGV